MPEKYIRLKFKERIFTGEVVNSYSSCFQGKLGICTDLFHNCVKHFILPLLLDLAGNQYYSFNLWGYTEVLDSARTLNGSNKIFLSLHMLQNGEGALTPKVILTFSSGKRCGVSTSVMCRPPGYPGRVSHAVRVLVWSQSQDISAYLQAFWVGKDHVGCGQCNDIICTR